MADVAQPGVTGGRRPAAGDGVDPPVLPAGLAALDEELVEDGLEQGVEWEDGRLVDADLSAQVAETAVLSRVDLAQVLLTASQLPGARITDARLTVCDLSGTLLSGASLLRAEMHNCRMNGVVLSDARLRHVRLVDCRLEEANLRFCRLENVVFEDCALGGADLTGATLDAVTFDRCDLRRVELHQATMTSTRLAACELEGLRGATRLGGATITSDELMPLSLCLLAELRISLED